MLAATRRVRPVSPAAPSAAWLGYEEPVRASEGIVHVSPPYVSTESDLDYVVERVNLVLDDLEGVILGRTAW